MTQKFIDDIVNTKEFTAQSTGYGIANEKNSAEYVSEKDQNSCS